MCAGLQSERARETYRTLCTCKQHKINWVAPSISEVQRARNLKLRSSEMWTRAVWWMIASQLVYCSPRLWRWRQYVALKYSYPPTRLCYDTSRKTKVIIFTVVRTVVSHAFNFFINEMLIFYCCSQYSLILPYIYCLSLYNSSVLYSGDEMHHFLRQFCLVFLNSSLRW